MNGLARPFARPFATPFATPLGEAWRAGSLLPLEIDFTALPDGSLPSGTGATWAIVSGSAVNTPTLGAELLTDPGLEATYTSGKCNTLTKAGLPTLTESADVHGGAKAQEFTGVAVANAVNWATVAALAGQWYQFGVWGKRTVGVADSVAAMVYQAGAQPTETPARKHASASYARALISFISTSTNTLFRYAARQLSGTTSDTVIVDDGTFRAITYSSLFYLQQAERADVVVKMQPAAMVDGTLFGLVLRADALTNPANAIFVVLRWHETIDTIVYVSVLKKVGSTYTRVLNETTVTIVADAWLEVRSSGNTVKVFYNNTQRGSDLTISDTELVSNTFHGTFSSGGNRVKRFFCTSELTDLSQQFAGTSFTNAFAGYRPIVQQWQLSNFPQYAFSFSNQSLDGHNSWSNLVRLNTGASTFIIDHANDGETAFERAALEAIIRRLWTTNPNTRIIILNSPTWITLDTSDNDVVNTPKNQAVIEQVEALAAHYGIPVVDYWGWCQSVVNGGTYTLVQLTADKVHPTLLGYQNMALLLQAALPLGGASKPAILPARLYDNGDYENTPTRKNGNANDGTTGTWTTTGTRIESSSTGATVTFSATCQSFGIYRSDGGTSSAIEVSVDGGAYVDLVLYQNGTPVVAGRGAHTVTLRVKTGGTVRIDEFWAI